MKKSGEEEKIIKSGLYSPGQLFIASLIGGPSIAGFIISSNLWAGNKKLFAIVIVIPGLLLGFAIVFFVDAAVQFLSSYYPHLLNSSLSRHLAAISLYFLILYVFALIITLILKSNTGAVKIIFPGIDDRVFHPRVTYPVIIISIIYFLAILTFNIYLWTVLVFYLFTHIYGYILIHKTFGNSRIAKPVLVSIIILACFLPFVDTTGQLFAVYGKLKLLTYTYLNLIAGYYMIFVFYLFLIIAAINALLLINRLLRIVPQKSLKNKKLILYTVLFTIITVVSVIIAGTHVNNDPIIRRYSISIPAKSSELNSLKVISVSDLHLKNITSTRFLKKMVSEIRGANPDIIFLPGDIAETYGNTSKKKLNEFIEILKDMRSEYGVYAIRGNHDFPGVSMTDKIDFYKRSGIIMLADSLIELDNKICIIGLKYRGNNEKRPIDSLIRFKTKNLPVILLDHAPYCLEEASANDIDVQFSGHTHYGQIWPLNYITEAVYDIAWGYKKNGNTHTFVSCGVQDALMPGRQDFSIPVRTGSISEIMEINIDFR